MTIPTVWEFVLGTLAAWRVWKLIADDDILEPLRRRIAPEGSWQREWLDCPYCSGFWVAALGTLAYYIVGPGVDVFGFLLTAFAMSAALVLVETVHDHLVLKKP